MFWNTSDILFMVKLPGFSFAVISIACFLVTHQVPLFVVTAICSNLFY